MTDAQTSQVEKLQKLHTAWQPLVTFLFGEAIPEAQFDGFEMSDEIAKPVTLFTQPDQPYRYKIQIPVRSFSNEVMLLADLIQEMSRGLYPLPTSSADKPIALSEGAAIYAGVTGIKQVFGEEAVDSYLNALKEQAFAYYDAFSYVAILLADDPQAIKKLRAIKPMLYQAEKQDFTTAGIEIAPKIRDILLLNFRA